MSNVVEVTDATYQARITASTTPTLLVFLDSTGETRRVFSPVLSEVAQRLDGTATIARIDTATNPASVHRWGVTQTPTMVLLRDGIVLGVMLGVRPADRLLEDLEEALSAESTEPT